ncbi:hypothetical protein [Actinomadura sp. 6N118]|uniref:hypothetical protein n=1 Tax=Actinomadura sp. 6N118 TaxID=3375151 RepID=UPI0037B87DE5
MMQMSTQPVPLSRGKANLALALGLAIGGPILTALTIKLTILIGTVILVTLRTLILGAIGVAVSLLALYLVGAIAVLVAPALPALRNHKRINHLEDA